MDVYIHGFYVTSVHMVGIHSLIYYHLDIYSIMSINTQIIYLTRHITCIINLICSDYITHSDHDVTG